MYKLVDMSTVSIATPKWVWSPAHNDYYYYEQLENCRPITSTLEMTLANDS